MKTGSYNFGCSCFFCSGVAGGVINLFAAPAIQLLTDLNPRDIESILDYPYASQVAEGTTAYKGRGDSKAAPVSKSGLSAGDMLSLSGVQQTSRNILNNQPCPAPCVIADLLTLFRITHQGGNRQEFVTLPVIITQQHLCRFL